MELKVISTGSSGNCYLLTPNSGKSLLIECGVTFKELKKGLNFNLSNIAGCIITHEHGDHAKCSQDVINAGIHTYLTLGTSLKLKLKNAECIGSRELVQIGDFLIVTFDTFHDAMQPVGFIIKHKECGNIVFATDTKELGYKFEDINHWIIEANFSENIMRSQIENDKLAGFLANRIFENHMSIEKCISTLKENDLSKTKSITLIHLSNKNANAEQFTKQVSRAVGIRPNIAESGKSFNL